ncbi:MAG: hypothetical protein J0I09_03745 [Sphingobacteriia bacterium]|nr:hypothetical protein [Sphingobacteriia bacterium]
MNFNASVFVNYSIDIILESLSVIADVQEKMKKLSEYLKYYNQLQIRSNIILIKEAINTKEQMCNWIEEELLYLEKQHLVYSFVNKKDTVSDETFDKLKFSVSVYVLAILGRASHDSKLLLNEVGKDVWNNIEKYCSTIKAEHVSSNSLDKKSHAVERSHQQRAVVILQEMIKWVQSY